MIVEERVGLSKGGSKGKCFIIYGTQSKFCYLSFNKYL